MRIYKFLETQEEAVNDDILFQTIELLRGNKTDEAAWLLAFKLSIQLDELIKAVKDV